MSERTRHVIGCMTGTSLDGLDAALVTITGTGLEMGARRVASVSRPLGGLADTLRSMAEGRLYTANDELRAARRLGELHAEAAAELASLHPVDLVAAHGQTIWHAPEAGLSRQLLDPWPIVRRLKAAVCYDLRQADLIAGGQGAPITPIADWVMFRGSAGAVANLGGVCNVTWLADRVEQVRGSDVGPCNLLLDGLVRRLYPGRAYDEGGRLAGGADPDTRVVDAIAATVDRFAGGVESLGREQFGLAFIDAVVEAAGQTSAEALLSSAVQWIAELLAGAVGNERLVLAGGGARNAALTGRIAGLCGEAVLSDELGVPAQTREATAFAVLGALSQDGVPITLPSVTGADRPGVAGVWAYP